MRRAGSRVGIRILDLAAGEPGLASDTRAPRGHSAKSRLFAEIESFSPELVAFSWRDLQVFSPQDSDSGFRDAYSFLYERSPMRRLAAAFRGLGKLLSYTSVIAENLALVATAARAFPRTEIALGGPAVRIFGDRLSPRLPSRVMVFSESELGPFFELLGMAIPPDPVEPALDLEFIESAFPQWPEYEGATIGVQTKLGCARECLYCLYPRLEGRLPRRRSPSAVAAEIEAYARRWGSRRFWLADAQLLSFKEDRPHLEEILERIAALGLGIRWSGYLRVSEVDPRLASIMVRSGLDELELSLGSGSQRIVDALKLGFRIEEAMAGLQHLEAAGYTGRVLVNLSLNAPGETAESLGQTFSAIDRIRSLFGPERVVPVPFFLAIQPGTGLEALAFKEGLLRPGYDSLSIWPWRARRLIFNPMPLGPIIGRACAEAFRGGSEGRGDRVLAAIGRELRRREWRKSL
jgi:radical SAM superfamily enzyme YgiQ (UPF0313 family)